MTPDRYAVSLKRIADIVETLRQLEIPDDRVHSLSVEHWYNGTQVAVHISGDAESAVALVDRIADRYGLPADDGETSNYARGEPLGVDPFHIYCGRPEEE